MTEVFIIPDGQQNAYYRQFGKLNRIEPIQLKDGNWCLPTRVIPMLRDSYVALKSDAKRFDKRKDATLAICNYADDTITDLEKFPKRIITSKDIHERYFKELKDKETVIKK